jgi:hypothetical protein
MVEPVLCDAAGILDPLYGIYLQTVDTLAGHVAEE